MRNLSRRAFVTSSDMRPTCSSKLLISDVVWSNGIGSDDGMSPGVLQCMGAMGVMGLEPLLVAW